MKAGKWNMLECFIGLPGYGKTYAAIARARELAKSLPCYVLAHDLAWSIEGSDVQRHVNLASAAMGLRARPSAIHALSIASGDEVIQFALDCAEASRASNGPPVLLMLDEGVAVDGISAHRLSPTMRKFVGMRRHLNIGLIVTAQSPMLIHYQLFALSTRIVLFRNVDSDGLKRLARFGVPPDKLARLPTLAKYAQEIHVIG